jgi:Sigma-70, region 4
LPGTKRGTLPTHCDLEMLRLRIIDGASLSEIGTIYRLPRERVRQRLHEQFELTGEPPAATARRGTGLTTDQRLERLIALRLHNREHGMSLSRLLAVFVTTSSNKEVLAAVQRMEIKGWLRIKDGCVTPTKVLRRMAWGRTSRTGRSTGSERTAR